MEVVSDVKVLEKEYPCLAAVNRCANCRLCFHFSYCCPQSFLMTVDVRWTPVAVPSSSPRRCSSPPGQSHQAAVLWRGTHPEDPHAGGKGKRTVGLAALKQSLFLVVWLQEQTLCLNIFGLVMIFVLEVCFTQLRFSHLLYCCALTTFIFFLIHKSMVACKVYHSSIA